MARSPFDWASPQFLCYLGLSETRPDLPIAHGFTSVDLVTSPQAVQARFSLCRFGSASLLRRRGRPSSPYPRFSSRLSTRPLEVVSQQIWRCTHETASRRQTVRIYVVLHRRPPAKASIFFVFGQCKSDSFPCSYAQGPKTRRQLLRASRFLGAVLHLRSIDQCQRRYR
jgi:hypothetical protein